MPSVSVIIPAYNAAAFIGEAIRSVLAQTISDYEIIVVDDGSTDGTREALQPFDGRIRYVKQNNKGVAAARNAGIALASGDFVCLLDADDVWRPDKLAQQLALMVANDSLGMVFSDAAEVEGTRILKPSILTTMKFGPDALRQVPIADAFQKLIIENFVPTSTVMIRRGGFSLAGLFDEELPNAEDRDMWLRLAAHGPIGCVPRVLATKRSHGSNISARIQLALESRIKVWKRNRERFPSLAPSTVYDGLLVEAYQQLGYIGLASGNIKIARKYAVAGMGCAIKYAAATRSRGEFRWFLSLALIPLSLMPASAVKSLWRLRNRALKRVPA